MMFSDGVIETENAEGEAFGYAGIKACLKSKQDSFDTVLQSLSLHRGNLGQQDDITLVEVKCDPSLVSQAEYHQPSNQVTEPATEWRHVATLYADTLKRLNPVPMVVNALMDIQGLTPCRESIFLVVTELFVNSLEHGLLELDSSLKKSADGFSQYFELRQTRLERLEQGYIKIMFHHRPDGDGGRLTIRVQDSGRGFDPTNTISNLDGNESMSGRGLTLIRQICESLTYSEDGRQATAVYRWPEKRT